MNMENDEGNFRDWKTPVMKYPQRLGANSLNDETFGGKLWRNVLRQIRTRSTNMTKDVQYTKIFINLDFRKEDPLILWTKGYSLFLSTSQEREFSVFERLLKLYTFQKIYNTMYFSNGFEFCLMTFWRKFSPFGSTLDYVFQFWYTPRSKISVFWSI